MDQPAPSARAVWKARPTASKEAKFAEVLDILAEAGDTRATPTLTDSAESLWHSELHRYNKRDGVMTRLPAGTWTRVFSLVQDLHRAVVRFNFTFDGGIIDGPATAIAFINNTNSNSVRFTALSGFTDCMFQPLFVFSDGSAVCTADAHDAFRAMLDALERDDPSVREAVAAAFRCNGPPALRSLIPPEPIGQPAAATVPATVPDSVPGGSVPVPVLRNMVETVAAAFRRHLPPALRSLIPPEPIGQPAAATVPATVPDSVPDSVAGTVPDSVLRASPLLRNMVEDMDGLTPAQLFQHLSQHLPADPAAADAMLADMDAWLSLPKHSYRFMPARAAEVANLAHFLGIECMADWIAERVGELLSPAPTWMDEEWG